MNWVPQPCGPGWPKAPCGRGGPIGRPGRDLPARFPVSRALGEFVRAAGLVRRVGVNLNQAMAKLNATGQRPGELLPYAAESIRRAERLDAAAEEIRKRLR